MAKSGEEEITGDQELAFACRGEPLDWLPSCDKSISPIASNLNGKIERKKNSNFHKMLLSFDFVFNLSIRPFDPDAEP